MPACHQFIAFSLFLGPLLYSASAAAAADSQEPESFENYPAGEIGELKTLIGTLRSERGLSIIDDAHAHTGKQCLQLTGGERTTLLLDVDPKCDTSGHLTFVAERWTSRLPFSFRIEKNTPDGWQEIFNGDSTVRVGRAFLNEVRIPLADPNIRRLRFSVTSPPGTGVLIDDIRIAPAIPQKIISVEQVPFTLPALIRADASPLVRLRIITEGTLNPLTVKAVHAHVALLQERPPVSAVGISTSPSVMPKTTTSAPNRDELFPVPSDLLLREGDNEIWLVGRVRADLTLEELLTARVDSIQFNDGKTVPVYGQPSSQRPGYAVCAAAVEVTCRVILTSVCRGQQTAEGRGNQPEQSWTRAMIRHGALTGSVTPRFWWTKPPEPSGLLPHGAMAIGRGMVPDQDLNPLKPGN